MDLRRISGAIALRLFWVACFLGAALALWSRPLPACEICVEDHVAATYDHAVIARAEAGGQQVLFVAVRGKDAGAPRGEAAVRKALAAVPGVDRASIRFSAFPTAASFAWNPRRSGPGEVLRAINGGLGGSGLQLIALKVIG
jgi:uncharacterized protein (DUF2236 family)